MDINRRVAFKQKYFVFRNHAELEKIIKLFFLGKRSTTDSKLMINSKIKRLFIKTVKDTFCAKELHKQLVVDDK